MEYLRPVRLVLKGDRDKAHAHVRSARRLIAALQARSGGATSNRDVQTLADGTTIEVVIAGADVTAIITAPGGKRKTRWFEDFIASPSGLVDDEDTAPTIFKYAPATPNNWVPYFWKSSSAGHASAPSPKGTYSAAFPKVRGGRHAAHLEGGGITHINSKGEAVNFYGQGDNKYIWPAYRQPYFAYSFVVNHLGYILLNTYEYAEDSNITLPAYDVMGAALRDGYLYAVLADFSAGMSYPSYPATPTDYGEVWVSPMYPDYQITQMLVRFKLSLFRDEATGLLRYRITPNSHEVLWQSALVRALSPWTFDAACEHAVNYVLPEEPHATFFQGAQQTYLSETHERLQLTIDHALGTASLTSSEATTAIAEDDGTVLHLEHTSGGNWQYRLGEHTMLAREWGVLPDPPPFLDVWATGEVRSKTRTILFADLRAKIILFLETGYVCTSQSNRTMTRRALLWVDGVEEVLREDTYASASGDAYLWARGQVATASALAQPASGLAVYMARFSGHVVYDDGTNPGTLAAFFVYESWPPLGHQTPITIPAGTSFGGSAVANSWIGQGAPPPIIWRFTGYDGDNDPAPSQPPMPEQYIARTGGCAVAPEDGPPRVCFGTRIWRDSHYNDPATDGVTINYITDGDLPALSGEVFDDQIFAISVTILGKPPQGQTVEY